MKSFFYVARRWAAIIDFTPIIFIIEPPYVASGYVTGVCDNQVVIVSN